MPIHAHRLRTAVTDSEARIAAKCARPVSAPEAGVSAVAEMPEIADQAAAIIEAAKAEAERRSFKVGGETNAA